MARERVTFMMRSNNANLNFFVSLGKSKQRDMTHGSHDTAI
jgi:hypothetical protein